MKIKMTFKYKKNNVEAYACGYKPEGEGIEILQEFKVLLAEPGYDLVKDGEVIGDSVTLLEDDTEENYTEQEHIDPEPVQEEIDAESIPMTHRPSATTTDTPATGVENHENYSEIGE